jgi:hypothetical protein
MEEAARAERARADRLGSRVLDLAANSHSRSAGNSYPAGMARASGATARVDVKA